MGDLNTIRKTLLYKPSAALLKKTNNRKVGTVFNLSLQCEAAPSAVFKKLRLTVFSRPIQIGHEL